MPPHTTRVLPVLQAAPVAPARPSRWLPLALLLVGALVTWRVQVRQQQDQQALEQAHFHAEAAEVVNALERQLQDTVTILRGVAGLFISSEVVTRQEFASYVQMMQLDTEYSGIQGIGFTQWVPAKKVPALEAAIQSEGFPNFVVRPPEPARPFYSSIVYLEPFDWRNQRAFGYDMFSEPVRQQAMRRAVETGQPALSDRITLLQETEKDRQNGFLAYVPIFKTGVPLTTSPERWAALRGWAYAPLRAGKLVAALMSAEPMTLSDRFDLELFAGPQASEETLLHKWAAPAAGPGPHAQHEEVLQTFGSSWLVRLSGPMVDVQRAKAEPAHQMVWYGAVLTLLVALLAQVVLRGRQRMARAYGQSVAFNQQLQAQQTELQLAATVMEASPIGIVVSDAQWRIVSVNPSFERITGYELDEVCGQHPWMLNQKSGVDDSATNAWHQVDEQGRWEGELPCRRKDGSVFPGLWVFARVVDAHGQTVQYIGLLQDITERRQQEDRVRHLAMHDYLTGLGNRALLIDRISQELVRAKRHGCRPAVLFLDLDRFKPINDQFGHDAGDAVLIAVARRLSAHLRGDDMVCRQGGDEFIVLLSNHDSADALLELARTLVELVAEPIAYGTHSLCVAASIGIATYPQHGTTPEALIRSADQAMYQAKTQTGAHVFLATGPAQPIARPTVAA